MTTRKQLETQSIAASMGRRDFPDSLTRPRTADNPLPYYVVRWYGSNGKLTGNGWANREYAEWVMTQKLENGTFYGTQTTYIAGYAF